MFLFGFGDEINRVLPSVGSRGQGLVVGDVALLLDINSKDLHLINATVEEHVRRSHIASDASKAYRLN